MENLEVVLRVTPHRSFYFRVLHDKCLRGREADADEQNGQWLAVELL